LQELFGGIDPLLMNEPTVGMGKEAGEALRARLWKPTPVERRETLLPFFWGKLARQGVVLGNPARQSVVRVTNRYRVSYPGYSEILTGRAQDEAIRGNDPIQNPTPSVLQFLREHWKLPREQAALFASWETFNKIGESRPGAIYINAGRNPSSLPQRSEVVAAVNRLQREAPFDDASMRFDAFTFALAMEYLKAVKPRTFYLALGETDDWAHARRYDRVLGAIGFFDSALERLWSWLQTTPPYAGATTMIVTSDHGRGATLGDWHGHGAKVEGAENIWLAVFGPDTPAAGEISGGAPCAQRDVAPTALALLGVDPSLYTGQQGAPVAAAMRR
jgi:arylsulfatase A-like enzyme